MSDSRFWLFAMVATFLGMSANVFGQTITVTVTDPAGTEISGYRWLLEEDATWDPELSRAWVDPDASGTAKEAALRNSQATNLHRSNMPVIASGHETDPVVVPDDSKRYLLSVLPDQNGDCQVPGNCYTMSGKKIDAFQTEVQVIVTEQP
ncbi:MAG: hypothetical protein MUP31_05315, partial [Xanthomonadales bacterium]|nr:hypothetical protein [Xanthomonadales bacterium]